MRKGMTESEAGRLGAEKSKATYERMKIERIEKYLSNPKLCKFCNNAMPYEKRKNNFCGSSCSCSFTNKGVRRHGKSPSNCKRCGKKTASHKAIYCSSKCQHDHRKDDFVRKWKDGEIDVMRANQSVSKTIRDYLIGESKGCCSICSLDKWTGKNMPLILDHIDGNAENNKPDNLRIVCPNCDALLPTYAGRNLGKGRSYRRERYKQGKSC